MLSSTPVTRFPVPSLQPLFTKSSKELEYHSSPVTQETILMAVRYLHPFLSKILLQKKVHQKPYPDSK